jgi:hypothetical protein
MGGSVEMSSWMLVWLLRFVYACKSPCFFSFPPPTDHHHHLSQYFTLMVSYWCHRIECFYLQCHFLWLDILSLFEGSADLTRYQSINIFFSRFCLWCLLIHYWWQWKFCHHLSVSSVIKVVVTCISLHKVHFTWYWFCIVLFEGSVVVMLGLCLRRRGAILVVIGSDYSDWGFL